MTAARDPSMTAWLGRWSLVPDGDPIVTDRSRLLPVVHDGRPAILKLARTAEERRGAAQLAWWAEDGAARVLARDGDAMLMERAMGDGSLTVLSQSGRDDDACRILCAVAARLHAPRPRPPPDLVPLPVWFRELETVASGQGGILVRAWASAASLLSEPREVDVLHGDLHHGNVLDFGSGDWRAIDPKGLLGERACDLAVLFVNPDLADPSVPVATMPGRLARRVDIVARAADVDRDRLLGFVLAVAGLSAA